MARRSVGDPLLYWIGVVNRRTGWSGSKVHVFLYRLLRGRLMGTLRGRPIVLLTTTGRRSKQPKTVPITVLREGDDFLAVASYAPHWQQNLAADSNAIIQDRSTRVRVIASVTSEPEDRERFRGFYPALTGIEEIARAEGREVPVFRFERSK